MGKCTKRNLCFTEDTADGSHKSNHIGEIIGITISAVVVIVGLVVIYRKKRKVLGISNVKTTPRGNVLLHVKLSKWYTRCCGR